MSLSEDVRPMLAARAATDSNAARLLEMFTKVVEILRENSQRGRNASPLSAFFGFCCRSVAITLKTRSFHGPRQTIL